jgi:hypothetical protein
VCVCVCVCGTGLRTQVLEGPAVQDADRLSSGLEVGVTQGWKVLEQAIQSDQDAAVPGPDLPEFWEGSSRFDSGCLLVNCGAVHDKSP